MDKKEKEEKEEKEGEEVEEGVRLLYFLWSNAAEMMTREKSESQPRAEAALARGPGGGPAPLYSTTTELTDLRSSNMRKLSM